jgi:hypothetical protein
MCAAFLFAKCQFCVKLIKGAGARCFEFITPPRVNTFQVERKITAHSLRRGAALLIRRHSARFHSLSLRARLPHVECPQRAAIAKSRGFVLKFDRQLHSTVKTVCKISQVSNIFILSQALIFLFMTLC